PDRRLRHLVPAATHRGNAGRGSQDRLIGRRPGRARNRSAGPKAGRSLFEKPYRLWVVLATGRGGGQVRVDGAVAVVRRHAERTVGERLRRGGRLVQIPAAQQLPDVDGVDRGHGGRAGLVAAGDRVDVVVVDVVDVGGALDGPAVGLHRVAGRVGVDAGDVEEHDRREDAQDRDDHEQLDKGETTLAAMRAVARILE